jgi:hypothetical protein
MVKISYPRWILKTHMTALDVLVTCRPHRGVPDLSLFPQVRGYYLAKHLRRSGLNAEFHPLPRPGLECEVLIWSEYELA